MRATQLGVNTVHFPIEALESRGIRRVEICLGRGADADRLRQKAMGELDAAKRLGIPFSVHLPLLLPEWYQEDYLSAFFLDPKEEPREASWRLLEYNLEALGGCGAEYAVLHFCGIYREAGDEGARQRRMDALDRLDALAERHGLRILVEYFGSNDGWWDYREWVEDLSRRPHLGLVVDTGHLFFAARWREFSYMEALEWLAEKADAFHFWTTRGHGYYGSSEAYRQWHHISPVGGEAGDDWAFDPETVLRRLKDTGRPIIHEGSPGYGGFNRYLDSVGWCAIVLGE